MRRTRTMVFYLFPAVFTSMNAGAAPLPLARDGTPEHVIVLSTSPTLSEATAARELQEHLNEITGGHFDIVSDADVAPGAPQIVVGASGRARQLLPDLDVATLGTDSIVMKTVGKHLVLTGQGTRGTLYAVYSFLEDIVGCRWWSSTESFIPHEPNLAIPQLDTVYTPVLKYRGSYFIDALELPFMARLRSNFLDANIPPEYGGHATPLGWGHTFSQLLPPSEYFDRHPEWYSLIDGQRVGENTQLCMTNEEMPRELARKAKQWLHLNPNATFVSISQNDGRGHERCRCDPCMVLEEKEGSTSGPLIHLVNKVAEEIEKEYPEAMVITLAYLWTQKPPRHVRPRRNVTIWLSTFECSFSRPLEEGDRNAAFRRDIAAWAEITSNLAIWDYTINFRNRMKPYPNLHVFAPNIRFFVRHGATGIFEQGESACTITDFARLRAWLLAHLLWNPELDERALMIEFMDGYYGAAGKPLLAYLDLIHGAVQESGVDLECVSGAGTSAYFSLDHMNEATRLFQRALEAVTDDPVLSHRVRRERLPLDHVWLMRYDGLKLSAERSGKAFLGPRDPLAACDDFFRFIGKLNGGKPWTSRQDNYEDSLRARFLPAGPPPEPCVGLPPDHWKAIQDSQYRSDDAASWVRRIDDAAASDGRAISMLAEGFAEWSVKCDLPGDLAYGNPWRCYVVARCAAKATQGPAMAAGIYNVRTREYLTPERNIGIEESRGSAYRTFDLGLVNVSDGAYVWFSPRFRSEDVEGVYVDRLFLVREDSR